MSGVYLDGGGVFPDEPLPDGSRVTFRRPGGAEEAVTVWVDESGVLHVCGQYRPVALHRIAPNHVTVQARPLPDPQPTTHGSSTNQGRCDA